MPFVSGVAGHSLGVFRTLDFGKVGWDSTGYWFPVTPVGQYWVLLPGDAGGAVLGTVTRCLRGSTGYCNPVTVVGQYWVL